VTPDPTARLRLDTALDQLLNPETQPLDRDHAAARQLLREANRDHLNRIRELARRLRTNPHDPAIRRDLRAAGQRHRARRAALAADLARDVAELPPLLDQILDAVQSSSSTGGPAGAGAHRSPIGLDAADLLADIRAALGARPGDDLHARLRAWAPSDLDAAADRAERWVADGRALLNPRRTLEAKAPCPVCGNRHVWQLDPATGERVRRAALQIDYATGSARCIAPSCTGYWPRERIDLLVAVLREG
jgi:hypothetical protein